MRGFLIAAVLALAVSPTWAQTQQQIDQCYKGSPFLFDRNIDACTAVIQSGRYSGNDLATAYYERASAYHITHQHYDQAIADYTEAINLKPDYVDAYYSRGMAYRNDGRYDQAIADWTKVIALSPIDDPSHSGSAAEAYYQRGETYEKMGKNDQAIADYRAALKLRPGMPVALQGLRRLGDCPSLLAWWKSCGG